MSEQGSKAPTPIVMFGAAGRMGQMILQVAAQDPARWQIAGAVVRGDEPQFGQPLSALIAGGPAHIHLTDAPPAEVPADAVGIDFSLPAGTLAHLDWARQRRHPLLIGTTGFAPAELAEIRAADEFAPVLLTPNTSLGVNVLFWLAQRAAQLLDEDYDVEITEMHHRLKKDAPSGTARRLAEVILEARGRDYTTDVDHGREGLSGERERGRLGMHALRGGDVAGDHTAIFAGPGERIELSHRASTRETFARGALRAASWLRGKAPGYYAMKDVLGL